MDLIDFVGMFFNAFIGFISNFVSLIPIWLKNMLFSLILNLCDCPRKVSVFRTTSTSAFGYRRYLFYFMFLSEFAKII